MPIDIFAPEPLRVLPDESSLYENHPNCDVEMQVVSCLNNPDVVFKILAHTKLWGKDQKTTDCGRVPPR